MTAGIGEWQGDAMRRICGGWDGERSSDGYYKYGWSDIGSGWIQKFWGVFKKGGRLSPFDLYTSSAPAPSYGWQIDTGLTLPTAEENRVKSIGVEYFSQTH